MNIQQLRRVTGTSSMTTRPNVMTLLSQMPRTGRTAPDATGTAAAVAEDLVQVGDFLTRSAKLGRHMVNLHDSCMTMHGELTEIRDELQWREQYKECGSMKASTQDLKDRAIELIPRLQHEIGQFARQVKILNDYVASFKD